MIDNLSLLGLAVFSFVVGFMTRGPCRCPAPMILGGCGIPPRRDPVARAAVASQGVGE